MATNELFFEATSALEVRVLPDLIDFSKVNYAQVSLHYSDQANGVDARDTVTFVANSRDAFNWKIELKDKTKTEYQWQATFGMADGSTRETPPITTDDLTIIPQAE